MKPIQTVLILGMALALGVPGAVWPKDELSSIPSQQSIEERLKQISPDIRLPVYKRPQRATRGGRDQGGSRGGVEDLPVVLVLAPSDHAGWTTHAQPILYWYLSKVTTFPLNFVLRDTRSKKPKPLLEVPLNSPSKAGVQKIRLGEYNVKLDAGVPYRWFITLVRDPEAPSRNIVAEGWVERVEFTEALTIIFPAAGEKDPIDLAKAGLWYDAVEAISESIEADPQNNTLRIQRAALLNQVGLPEIAQFDLRQSGIP